MRDARWVVAVGLAVGLSVAACSDTQSLTEEEQAQIDLMLEQSGGADPLADFTPEQTKCVETGLVDADVDLGEAATGPASDEQRTALTRVVLDCAGDLAAIGSYVESFTSMIALNSGVEVSAEESACLLRHIIEESPDPAKALAGTDDDANPQVVVEGITGCFTPENADHYFGVEGSGFQAYGDDDRLDAMFDECSAGDDRVCDLLYAQSAVGSEYSTLAAECAGRGLGANDACSPEATIDFGTGFAHPDSPGLAVLASDCEGGDLTACDLLFMIAPAGSEFESIGRTCAGRVVVGAMPDCRTRLG